jgi:hypothetical protein
MEEGVGKAGGDDGMTGWRTLRKAMVAASAGLALIAGAAMWWQAWMAWQQSGNDDAQLAMPSIFALVWASLLLAGALLAVLRKVTSVLMAGWLLCLGQTVYWGTEYLSPSWRASAGLPSPWTWQLVPYIAIFLGLPVLGVLLPLPDLLQRRREKAKADTGVSA